MQDECGRVFLGSTPGDGKEGTRREEGRAGVGCSRKGGVSDLV